MLLDFRNNIGMHQYQWAQLNDLHRLLPRDITP